jgi:hypothetical protein
MPDDGIPNNIGDAVGTVDTQDKTIFDKDGGVFLKLVDDFFTHSSPCSSYSSLSMMLRHFFSLPIIWTSASKIMSKHHRQARAAKTRR